MPLIRLKEAQGETWRYVVLLPPVTNPNDLIYLDKGEPLPVATARKIIQAIGRNEPCGEADGFAWQHDMPVPPPSFEPFPVDVGVTTRSW